MTFNSDLARVLKYVTTDKTDFYPAVSSWASDSTPHLAFADYLQEQDEADPLAARIRHEVKLNDSGHRPRPVSLGEAYSQHDYVLHGIRTGHPNPTVRALAGMTEVGLPPKPELLDLLFHSDHPADQDAAVYLSPEDKHSTHSSHRQLKELNGRELRDAGLEAKTVRGTVYLLDHEHPELGDRSRHNWGAPVIEFTSPVNDHAELGDMLRHARQIAADRASGPAVVGPATFGS